MEHVSFMNKIYYIVIIMNVPFLSYNILIEYSEINWSRSNIKASKVFEL